MPLSKGRSSPSRVVAVREGWLTVVKVKRGLFRAHETEEQCRVWVVLPTGDGTVVEIAFFSSSSCTERPLKPIRLSAQPKRGQGLFRVSGDPKHTHMFFVKNKEKKVKFIAESQRDLHLWLDDLSKLLKVPYKIEKVMWEYLDDNGLWQAFPEECNKTIEERFFEKQTQFTLGSPDLGYSYNLASPCRYHPRNKKAQKMRRTTVYWDTSEVAREKLKDLPVIWEWYNWEEEWYPYPRSLNSQIEELFQSEGSKWLEVIVSLPSPTPILLDLHHQRQVNLSTGVRWPIRRLETPKANAARSLAEMMITDTDSFTSENSSGYFDDFCAEAESDTLSCSYSVPVLPCSHNYEVLEEDSATVESEDDEESGSSSKLTGNQTLLSEDFRQLQLELRKRQFPRERILKYTRELGEGQFGKVHLADAMNVPGLECKDPVQIAVKQLRLSEQPAHHSQQIVDFLREAKEMTKFDHPRIVKLLCVCTVDYPLLLITEFMNKGDLLGVLQDSRPYMPLPLQMRFAAEVAEGMAYLSTEMGYVHRDIAARNIMVQEDSAGNMHSKIADFGLSRHVYSGIYAPTTVRKARPLPAKWMALESLIDFVFTTQSDVWSYGVLLWEIMTLGRNPYPGIDNRDLLEQIEENGLKLGRPKKCPTAVFELITQCTDHNPKKRATFVELHRLFARFQVDAEEGRLTHDHDSTLVEAVSAAGQTRETVGAVAIGKTPSDDVATASNGEKTLGDSGDTSAVGKTEEKTPSRSDQPEKITADKEREEVASRQVVSNEASITEEKAVCENSPSNTTEEPSTSCNHGEHLHGEPSISSYHGDDHHSDTVCSADTSTETPLSRNGSVLNFATCRLPSNST